VKPHALDAAFTEEFNAILKRRNLTDERVAQHFNVSSAMIERWRKGVSSPHPSFREFVLRDLEAL
jgi:transcriptional regulator with XRE-family HTH domain